MIYVGIDIAKDKHDRFISNSDAQVLFHSFTISNNREDFDTLFQKIYREPSLPLLIKHSLKDGLFLK